MNRESLFERIARARLQGSISRPVDDVAKEKYPTVMEFLTRNEASEELEKVLASVTVKCGLGEWLVELSDPGFAISLSATSSTLDGCWEALERSLTSPNPPIRNWRGETGDVKKRKRRQQDSQ